MRRSAEHMGNTNMPVDFSRKKTSERHTCEHLHFQHARNVCVASFDPVRQSAWTGMLPNVPLGSSYFIDGKSCEVVTQSYKPSMFSTSMRHLLAALMEILIFTFVTCRSMADATAADPPLACGSNSGLALAWLGPDADGQGPSPSSFPDLPSKEETVELPPHANGGIGGF